MPEESVSQPKKSKKKIIGAAVAAAVLIGGGFVACNPFAADASPSLTSADYTTVEPKQFTNKVAVNGTIEPRRVVSISSGLDAPLGSLNVSVGDRVQANDIVARMDTAQLERDRAAEKASQAQTSLEALNAVENARQELLATQERNARGFNSEITGAQDAAKAKQQELEAATADYDSKARAISRGSDPTLREQESAIRTARQQSDAAALAATRAGVGFVDSTIQTGKQLVTTAANAARIGQLKARVNAGGDDAAEAAEELQTLEQQILSDVNPLAPIDSALGAEDAARQAQEARAELEEQQRNFNDALESVNQELAEKQRAVAAAHSEAASAQVAVEAAKFNADQEVASQQQAVDQAWRGAQATQNSGQQQLERLDVSIASAELHAPIGGMVVATPATVGANPTGPVLTIADDSSLIIKAEVKEADIASVKAGQKVRFTSKLTGDKKMEGRVSRIAPMSTSAAAALESGAGAVSMGGAAASAGSSGGSGSGGGSGASSSGGSSGFGSSGGGAGRPTFQVEIAVQGNPAGLMMGGSAKADIITSDVPQTLTVPKSALYSPNDSEGSADAKGSSAAGSSTDDAGTANQKVLVVRNNGAGEPTVEEISVQVGHNNAFDAVITGGQLRNGDKVITDSSRADELKGQVVSLEDDA